MTALAIFEYISGGGIGIFLILMLIEWVPIKLNPIGWLGKRFNQKQNDDAEKFRKDMTDMVNMINDKLDAHIADSYRNEILQVQKRLVEGEKFTQEEWLKIIKTCQDYDTYIRDNDLTNDQVNEAMAFIKRRYQTCLDNKNFLGLPNN